MDGQERIPTERPEKSRRHIPQKIIDAAIATTPMQAGIADGVIRFERTCVTGISAALGIPGGLALASSARPSPPSAA